MSNHRKMNEFDKAAQEEGREGQKSLVAEFWGFLRENKKWWLLPILAVLLLFGLLIFLTSTGLAPFIYTLF
jgi:hypothetical protein